MIKGLKIIWVLGLQKKFDCPLLCARQLFVIILLHVYCLLSDSVVSSTIIFLKSRRIYASFNFLSILYLLFFTL